MPVMSCALMLMLMIRSRCWRWDGEMLSLLWWVSLVCVCVCVCVFIKLHITAQPGPVKLIFHCYSNNFTYEGSVVRTTTSSSNKPRQRGHAIATLSLATTYFYLIYLRDAIVTSFVVLYRPPRHARSRARACVYLFNCTSLWRISG